MKKLVFIVAMLCCFPGWSFEPATDLRNSTVMAAGRCTDEGMLWECFAIIKGDSKYLVMADRKGIALVYEVSEFKSMYTTGDLKKVWQRVDT